MRNYADFENRFRHHAPVNEEVANKFAEVREWHLALAKFLDKECPDGREKASAITKLEESMFWANAAIARNQAEVIGKVQTDENRDSTALDE